MQEIELISNELCPYTQRIAIQLAEKGAPFRRTYIDLADKPAWFVALSPLGKVPVMRAGETCLFETNVICEYVEEAVDGRPLHPADPGARAAHRAAIELASSMIADVFGFYTAPDSVAFDRKRGDLRGKVHWLEGRLGSGPYLEGARFHLVDAAFAPIFRLFDGFDRIEDFGFVEGAPRVRDYRAALAARESVRRAVVPDYEPRFLRYLAARGSFLSARMSEAARV